LNVHRVSDARQIEVHSAEPFVSNPIPYDVEIGIAKIKRYKSPGGDKILAKLIQTEGETLQSDFHKNINSIYLE
jgi:hypothetical protein